MYRWKVVSPIKSSRGDLASGCLSRDFEKKMMSYTLVGITDVLKENIRVFGILSNSVVGERGSNWQG